MQSDRSMVQIRVSPQILLQTVMKTRFRAMVALGVGQYSVRREIVFTFSVNAMHQLKLSIYWVRNTYLQNERLSKMKSRAKSKAFIQLFLKL